MPSVRQQMLVILFVVCLFLVGPNQIGAGEDQNAGSQSSPLVGKQIASSDSQVDRGEGIWVSGEKLSAAVLATMRGKGLAGSQACGGRCSELLTKIILWDEVGSSQTNRVEFSNFTQSMRGSQRNNLIIGGK